MLPDINRRIVLDDSPKCKEKKGNNDLAKSSIFCSICFQELQDAAMDLTVTRCNHYFCTSCLLKNMKYNNKCPLCRVELLSPNKKFSISIPLSGQIVEEEMEYYGDYINNSINYAIDTIQYYTARNTITEEIKKTVYKELIQVFENFGMGICLNVNTRFREYDVFNTGGVLNMERPHSPPSPAVSVSIIEQTENLIVDSQSAPVILSPVADLMQGEIEETASYSGVNEQEANVSAEQIEPEGVFTENFEM